MKERPILFSGSMVRALIAGTKTQTRRVVKLQPDSTHSGFPYWNVGGYRASWCRSEADGGPLVPANPLLCPYGQPGDRLWVRETFYAWGRWETRFSARKGRDEWHFLDMTLECGKAYQYAGDRPQPLAGKRDGGTLPKWFKRPAIHMPRAASRITLEINSVRVERLQDIHPVDALKEGLEQCEDLPYRWDHPVCLQTAVKLYSELWEQINGPGSWAQNPWVWVVEFKRVQQASSGRPSQLEDAPCSA